MHSAVVFLTPGVISVLLDYLTAGRSKKCTARINKGLSFMNYCHFTDINESLLCILLTRRLRASIETGDARITNPAARTLVLRHLAILCAIQPEYVLLHNKQVQVYAGLRSLDLQISCAYSDYLFHVLNYSSNILQGYTSLAAICR